MKLLLFIILFSVLAVVGSQKLKSNNEFIAMYVNWVILLVAVNLIITTFIYLFTHSVKKGDGNQGVRGKIGRRGEEGEPDYCNFCKPIGMIERDELLDKIESS